MQRQRRARRGIFIISVLFLVVLVTMFVGAASELAPWAFRKSNNSEHLSSAQRAARSGVEYALARLKSTNYAWKADDGTRNVVVDTPELVVVEEKGNVIGLIRKNGSTSQFRLRFNWQDGGPARDGLDDAPAAMQIGIPYVSFNNVLGTAEKDSPKANGPGNSVPATPTRHTVVPARGVYLACEGRSGGFLSAADAVNPNPSPGFDAVTVTRVETVFKINNIGQPGLASVVASAGSLKADLPTSAGTDPTLKRNLELDSADGSALGRLRSKQAMQFTGGDTFNLVAAPGKQGEYRFKTSESGISKPTSVQSTPELDTDDLYKIPWSQVKTASGANTLKGGVYTVWQDGSVHYYDMTLAQYKTFMNNPANQSDGGVPFTLPATVTTSAPGSLPVTFKITGDTLVTAGTATSDLVIIPKKGADAGDGGPSSFDQGEVAAGLTNQAMFWDSADSEFDYNEVTSPHVGVPLLVQKVVRANGHNWTSGDLTTPLTGGLKVFQADADDPRLQFSSSAASSAAAVQANFIPLVMAYLNNPATVLDANDLAALAAIGVSSGGGGLSELPVPDTATPQSLTVSFEPTAGSAVLSGPGNVTLGAQVKGKGGTITAQGNINLVGLGVDLAANPNEGVSLYSQKDILISTFDKQLTKYHDVGLKGVVYCWGNLTALLGTNSVPTDKWGKFQLNGALVAYGKDPDLLTPATKGNVQIKAKKANLKFDSSYLLNVMSSLPPGAKLGRIWWYQQ